MSYKGKWTPKNTHKYEGDPSKIVFRSLWERQAFRWCDMNSDVRSWSSEEVCVPYRSKLDGKIHRYFVDLKITYNTGKTVLVEIKPKKQVQEPKPPKRRTKRYLNEVRTYVTNVSKWEHAHEYAENRGWEFEIWTEDNLKRLGIKLYK